MPRSHRTGRIRAVDRDADDDVEILGADVAVNEDHLDAVRETTSNKIDEGTKRNYRNRLKKMMTFWEKNYPDYHAAGVRALTEEDLANPDVYWWKNKGDLVYTGLNVKFVLAHMAVEKKKESGKTSARSMMPFFLVQSKLVNVSPGNITLRWTSSSSHSRRKQPMPGKMAILMRRSVTQSHGPSSSSFFSGLWKVRM